MLSLDGISVSCKHVCRKGFSRSFGTIFDGILGKRIIFFISGILRDRLPGLNLDMLAQKFVSWLQCFGSNKSITCAGLLLCEYSCSISAALSLF